jgi:ubiquitin-protein ligase
LTIDEPFEDDICTVQTKDDNYYAWQATVTGPLCTPYEDGLFFLDVDLPQEFPLKPPKVKFTTNIWHCNVSEKGEICLDLLKDKWSPAVTIKTVLNEIIDLLKTPNPDNPLRAEVAKQFKEDRELHDKTAAEYTRKYAQ